MPLSDQIGALNAVARAGKVRHIGVSNFNRALMSEAVRLSEIPLVTNQFEYHPYLNQSLLIDATRGAGLAVTGYCGMAVGRVLSDPTLTTIASRHRRSIAQIVLRWLIQQDGVVALSRTTNESRSAENLAVFDFELDAADMAAIRALAQTGSRIVNPPGLAPDWDETPTHAYQKKIVEIPEALQWLVSRTQHEKSLKKAIVSAFAANRNGNRQMAVELRDWRWAIVSSQHRSLRQAAEALNIRQLTLSRGLLDLEYQLGATLFERTNGGARPTVAGQEFLDVARRIVEETETITARLKTRSSGGSG